MIARPHSECSGRRATNLRIRQPAARMLASALASANDLPNG
jgi:hypothetical protein